MLPPTMATLGPIGSLCSSLSLVMIRRCIENCSIVQRAAKRIAQMPALMQGSNAQIHIKLEDFVVDRCDLGGDPPRLLEHDFA